MMKNQNYNIWGNCLENANIIPKTIWTFWDSPTASPLVEICFEQIRRILPDYTFNIITKTNANQFLENLPQLRTDISFINYTDLIRLRLLEKYGGIWMDASVLLTEDLDWLHQLKSRFNPDFIGFSADFFSNDEKYPLMETWFLASNPNNVFIKNWSQEFQKCYNSPHPHQYFDLEKKTIPNFCQKIDEALSSYLIAYLAATKITRENDNYRLLLIPSSTTAHYYNFSEKTAPHRLKNYFLANRKIKYWNLIKFERKGRNALDEDLLNGLYVKKSVLYQITQNKKYLRRNPIIFFRYIKFIAKNLIDKLK